MTDRGNHSAAGRMSRGVTVLAVLAVGALLWAERRRALRRSPAEVRQHGGERVVTNLVMAGLTAAVTHLAMQPVIAPLAERTGQRRTGLVRRLPVPEWARDAVAVLLLDYTLYWWHVAEHRVPWLYRFHQVHHADLALDSTTALRPLPPVPRDEALRRTGAEGVPRDHLLP